MTSIPSLATAMSHLPFLVTAVLADLPVSVDLCVSVLKSLNLEVCTANKSKIPRINSPNIHTRCIISVPFFNDHMIISTPQTPHLVDAAYHDFTTPTIQTTWYWSFSNITPYIYRVPDRRLRSADAFFAWIAYRRSYELCVTHLYQR